MSNNARDALKARIKRDTCREASLILRVWRWRDAMQREPEESFAAFDNYQRAVKLLEVFYRQRRGDASSACNASAAPLSEPQGMGVIS